MSSVKARAALLQRRDRLKRMPVRPRTKRQTDATVHPLANPLRISTRTAVCTLIAALSLSAAATEVKPALDQAWDSLNADSRSLARRELAPARNFGVSEFLLRAGETIPPGTRYGVVVGDVPPTEPVLHEGIPPLVAYWLFPSRYTGRYRSR